MKGAFLSVKCSVNLIEWTGDEWTGDGTMSILMDIVPSPVHSRRKRACELAGLDEMPVVVSEFTDNQATIIMCDSNLQCEKVLPSD